MHEYFSHDYGARNDIKLKKLFIVHGHEGKGVYWDLVEMLYENSGYISRSDISTIAYDLRTTEDLIVYIVDDFNLFKTDETGRIYSKSILSRLEIRDSISKSRSEAANKRWNKCKSNTNAKQMHSNSKESESKSNAIKENKINKENKENFTVEKYIPPDDLSPEEIQKRMEMLRNQ